MSNAWDKAQEMAEQHSSSLFVRLTNDGDKVIGVFLGDPYPREVVWTGEKYVDGGSPEAEKHVKQGKSASLRIAINFYVPADKGVKVYEMGAGTFKTLIKLREKYGLDQWSFEIERHGKPGDTKTVYSILPEQQLNEKMRAHIAQLELHKLEEVVRGDGDDDGGEADDFDSYERKQDGPLDAEVVAKMLPRLKALPRELLDTFLGKLQVQRVKDLKASQQAAALELLHTLEAEARPSKEIDPFG
jgi:hypothetical protein